MPAASTATDALVGPQAGPGAPAGRQGARLALARHGHGANALEARTKGDVSPSPREAAPTPAGWEDLTERILLGSTEQILRNIQTRGVRLRRSANHAAPDKAT